MTGLKKLVVFGGNGYVGQMIVANALKLNINVTSVNRSGELLGFHEKYKIPAGSANVGTLKWQKGDVFKEDEWKDELNGCDGVVSCLGAFGSNEFMERINGDANIHAMKIAKKMNVERFSYVSSLDNNLSILPGYFNGKKRAEAALKETYDNKNIGILKPSFVYGTRDQPIGGINLGIPLWMAGKPMEWLFSTKLFSFLRHNVPGMLAILAPPISLENVANSAIVKAVGSEAVLGYKDEAIDTLTVLEVEDMNRIGAKVTERINNLMKQQSHK